MVQKPKNQDEPTEEEIERRRNEIARRMLNTPPSPHAKKETGGVQQNDFADEDNPNKSRPS